MRKLRKCASLVLLILAVLLSGCGATGEGQGDPGMDPADLRYFPTSTYWSRDTLVVDGMFCNLSSDYDIVSLEDAFLYLVDADQNIVATVSVRESAVGCIPHNGSRTYNFTVHDIPGGSQAYRATDLLPVLETSFNYGEHLSEGCPYCTSSKPQSYVPTDNLGSGYPCTWCGGEGSVTCTVCHGTGRNDDYDDLSPVMKGFSKKYCEACDGKGYIVCGRCHGSGVE